MSDDPSDSQTPRLEELLVCRETGEDISHLFGGLDDRPASPLLVVRGSRLSYRVERLLICQGGENSVWVEADLPVKPAYQCTGLRDAWFAAPHSL